ncbi:Sad1 / UNC-like C-terminal [Fragilaria crotonensis]|nr:Sad1 / UNC-like C-terminal [Fragilaria crotonensis]
MGVLPLLAKDDVPDVHSDVMLEEGNIDDVPLQNAAEKMHDDALTAIPSLRLLNFVSPSSDNFEMASHLFDFDSDFLGGNSSNRMSPSILSPRWMLEKEEVGTGSADAPDTTSKEEVPVERQPSDAENLPVDEIEQHITEISIEEDATVDVAATESDSEPQEVTEHPAEGDDEEDGTANRLLVDYANKAAGALILERSPSMKGASNLLTNDKDKYAITPCKDKKFVVVGLSEDILVKQIKIANYELYSSHVKDFQVLGSQTMGQWVDLGTFTANHGNGEQAFDLPEPSWARYLKFRFISHHRNEHYCTLSQIQVHGSTMLQGFREQWKEGEEQEEEDDEHESEPDVGEDASIDEIVEEAKTQQEQGSASESPKESKTLSSGNSEDIETVASAKTESEGAGDVEHTNSIPIQHDVDVEEQEQEDNSDVKKPKGLQALHQSMLDLQSIPVPNALEFVRFDLAASRVVYANTSHRTTRRPVHILSSLKSRQGFGRSMQHAMKAVVAEATDAVQQVGASSSVSFAVRELQSRIQTTIGKTWELHHTIQTMIGKALPGLKPDWSDAVDLVGDKTDSPDAAETIVAETPRSQMVNITHTQDDVVEKASPVEEATPVPVETTENVAKAGARSQTTDEPVLGVEMSEGLANIISRYPSAKCLEALHFPTFKKSMIAKAAAKATAGSSSTNSHAGKMEPIFKTLTDEIKALQMSQNVHDQFARALMTCYQDIMIDLANDLHATQVLQEDRIAKLEAGMKDMNSQSWWSQVPSRVIFLLAFFLSLVLMAYSQLYVLVKDVSFHLFLLGGEPHVIGWACFLAIVLLALLAWREVSRKQRIKPPPLASQPEEMIAPVLEIPCHATVRLDKIGHTALAYQKNARIPKSRSLQLFPAE